MSAIEFNNVWEKYRIKFIKEGKVSWEEIWALEDISFKVDKSEVLGVIGQNGAGKTTLLRLIAGMLIPDRGKINVEGKVSALMELGAGFNPEFTGRENIALNARLYGLDEEKLEEQTEKIIEFADIGKFIDAPIKYYSQGMYMRLAFALAIFVEPDILLIDDILAVGDEEARQKCIKKIFELKHEGKTIILVSHDMNMISRLCNRVILLEKGKVIQESSPEKVITRYLETVGDRKGIAVLEKDKLRIIFNNGRINLIYSDYCLTKGMGGYISYFIPSISSWFSSLNLSWQLKSSVSNKIIAEGRTHEGVLSQIWILQLQEDNLHWQIEIKEEAIKEPHIDLVFTPQYKKWITLDKNGDFPPFAYKSNWQDLGINNCPEGVVGITPDDGQDLPSLILEIEDKDDRIRLLNTDYEQEARVIQPYLSGNNFAVDIKIFTLKDRFENYIENLRNQFVLEQQKELKRLLASRTISSGALRLFADLDSKSLRIYYKDKELTKVSGLHASFLINKAWYDTSIAEWQVEKQDSTLILHLSWKQPKLTQLWRFSFKNNSLLWQVSSKIDKPLNLELLKFGLLLTEEYKTFFCGYQQQEFPSEFTSWQDLPLENPKAELFGLRKQNNFPAIVLENKGGLSCLIQNSDSQTSCRALQLSIPLVSLNQKATSFAIQLNFFEDEALIENYLKEEKQKLLFKQQQEQSRLCTISSGNSRLFADLEKKSLRLYYKDKEITKVNGLHTAFSVKGKRYDSSFEADWQLEKKNQESLILTLNYEELPLVQRWKLIFREDNVLDIDIEMDLAEEMTIFNQDVRLELQDKYETWLTTYEGGDFSVNQYINNIAPVRLKESKISKIILKSGTNNHIPSLFFESTAYHDNQIFGIYKRNEENEEYICLNFSRIISKKEKVVNPGRYTYFMGKIVLDKEPEFKEESLSDRGLKLCQGNLRFIFDQGRGRIFFKERELTIGLGIYTSVRSSGIWYDSYQAIWHTDQKDDNKIVVLGDWPYIPISQIWQIELIDENSIHWKVDMEIYEELNLEIEQANLMLSSEYKTWEIPSACKGKFLDEYTHDYDIYPFRFWYGKTEEIIAESKNLPQIAFQNDKKDEILKAIVENTDYLYQARLLQYQKSNINKLLPRKYPYFEGVIKIGPGD